MKIVFLGDSITQNFHALNNHPQVINMGISGNRTLDVIERLEKVKEVNPERLFLMIGTNDVMTNNQIWFTDFPIHIETTYRFIVKYLINHLQTNDIILLSVLPVSSVKLIDPNQEAKINQEINQLNQFIHALADEFSIKYLDINHHFKEEDRLKKDYTFDGIHLTTQGYNIFYEKIKKYLE